LRYGHDRRSYLGVFQRVKMVKNRGENSLPWVEGGAEDFVNKNRSEEVITTASVASLGE